MKARTQTRDPFDDSHDDAGRHGHNDRAQAASLLVSAGALAVALKRGGASGLALGALGGWLAYRATTGEGPGLPAGGGEMARSLDRGLSVRHTGPLHLKTNVTINRSPEDLYQFWRDFTRLPQILNSITDIQPAGADRTRWTAKTPAGNTLNWEAELIEDVPNERISWRSLEGSTIPQRGEIRFVPGPADRGTVVELNMRYELPGGAIGQAASGFINALTREAAREDLRHFKQLMESGELPTGARTAQHKQYGEPQ